MILSTTKYVTTQLKNALTLQERRALRGFRRTRPPRVDALDQQRQLRGGQLQCAIDNRRPNEPAVLQTLGEETKTRPIPSQNLHIVAALAPEHERCPGIRISAQNLCDIGGEPVKATTHVDRPQRQIDLHTRRDLKHQRSPSADR